MSATKKERAKPVYAVDFNTIQLETGIPVPEHVTDPQGSKEKFPLGKLKPGGSFSFPIVSSQQDRQLRAVKGAIYHHRKFNPERNFVFITSRSEGVIRVWRTKDTPTPKPRK